jgi:O-acetyl-ADP-ribose deacetylase (regulator of RNase III)
MALKYFTGDILLSNEKIIVHGCNCKGVMGAGIAKAIAHTHPEVFNAYISQYNDEGLALGSVQYVSTHDRIIINAMTQNNYGHGRQVSYDAIEQCMITINKDFSGIDDAISMPKIGAGLGGGNWNIIEKIITETITDIDVHVYEL